MSKDKTVRVSYDHEHYVITKGDDSVHLTWEEANAMLFNIDVLMLEQEEALDGES